MTYCRDSTGYPDVVTVLESAYRPGQAPGAESNTTDDVISYGFVYLARAHPGEYKIGRTNIVDRRLSELGTSSAVEPTLIHEIKTDDPVGVEAYWHARFADKRLRGEWFRLNAADVKAFKRWRRIF